ncbi:MAG: MBL fold metallo-hydrolase [Thermoprotei archaeon]|nr:MAG: MBL fold metallo-hydrolase [Thermoprotei archaeon]RLF02553.1 MAG: MBL fold metallo-hydrolase [Thermoprotei archaeon]
MRFKPVWFDSLGAKSSSITVECSGVRILIDPGVAIMHPSFPAPGELKREWTIRGREEIKKAARKADIVIITHYHYDHFTDFDKELYERKVVLAKNPNEYINDSQRERSLRFYTNFFKELGNIALEEVLEEPSEKAYSNPLEELPIASSIDYGDYAQRKRELLEKGLKWFERRAEKWSRWCRIPERDFPNTNTKLLFADGREYEFKGVKIRFTRPLFHGIEFSRVGWVVSVVIECQKMKLLYTSDLNGPIIEDYAEWIISEKPQIIILDGPMTYMLGYTLNLINLQRAVKNAVRIVEESGSELIIYDHHLPREKKFREHTKEVWEKAEKKGIRLVTAAEYLGLKPVVLEEWT